MNGFLSFNATQQTHSTVLIAEQEQQCQRAIQYDMRSDQFPDKHAKQLFAALLCADFPNP